MAPITGGGQNWSFQRAKPWQGLNDVFYISAVGRTGFFLANDDCYDIDENEDYISDGITCGPISIQKAAQLGLTQIWILVGTYPYFTLKHTNQVLGRKPPYLLTGNTPGSRPSFSASGTTFRLQRVG